jgi:hypothetical protein
MSAISYFRRRSRWSTPAQLVRTILHRRTLTPAPYIYLLALLLGIVLGSTLDAWLGWRWWFVAVVFISLVWLAFLSTAFIGPGRGPSLRTELLDAIRPRKRLERHWLQAERQIRACSFPLYGLDGSWKGLRLLGGHGGDGGVTSVELAHGGPEGEGPEVQVETELSRWPGEADLWHVAHQLWSRVERPPEDLPPQLRGEWMQRRFHEHRAREAHWMKVSIPVDGVGTEFNWVESGEHWVAHTVIGDLSLTLRGHRFPVGSVRLETVTDVEPYLEGLRRYFEEQRRLHEG